jgi:PAS domain S-box-containing protein
MDITESVRLKDELQQKLRFEKLIVRLSAKFVNLPAGEIDREITHGLQLVNELFDVDEIFILQFQAGQEMAGVTHGWFRSGKVRELEFKASEFLHVLPWAGRKILENEVIVFERIDELPAEAVNEREYLRKIGLESAVVLPMFAGKNNIGAFFIQTLGREKKWHRDTVSQLTLIAELFSSALDRKNASDKLIESEQRLRSFMDFSPAFMYIKDRSGKHLYTNSSLLKYFNIKLDEFIGTTAYDFLPEDVARKIESCDREVIENEVQLEMDEYSFVRDGKMCYFGEIKFPIKLYSGEVGVGGIVIEITPLKEKEERLRKAYE